jgi:hypothetical protein
MLGYGWLGHNVYAQNAALGLVIMAAALTILKDGMRTRRQISAIAKRREQQDRDRPGGGGSDGNVRQFVRPDWSY